MEVQHSNDWATNTLVKGANKNMEEARVKNLAKTLHYFSLQIKQKSKSLNISACERPTAKVNPFLESSSNAQFCRQ